MDKDAVKFPEDQHFLSNKNGTERIENEKTVTEALVSIF